MLLVYSVIWGFMARGYIRPGEMWVWLVRMDGYQGSKKIYPVTLRGVIRARMTTRVLLQALRQSLANMGHGLDLRPIFKILRNSVIFQKSAQKYHIFNVIWLDTWAHTGTVFSHTSSKTLRILFMYD